MEREGNLSDAPTDYVKFVDKPTNVKRGDAIKSTMGGGHKRQEWLDNHPKLTLGVRPTCSCDQKSTGKSVVLDPSMGSGTVAQVAQELGRDWIGIDLNEKYKKMAMKRIQGATIGLPI